MTPLDAVLAADPYPYPYYATCATLALAGSALHIRASAPPRFPRRRKTPVPSEVPDGE